jgi:hypothetical protein
MRSNGNNSISGRGNDAGRYATTTTTLGGHGAALPRRASSGNDQPKEAKGWFKPVGISAAESGDLSQEEFSDCPDGICPVPWAKKEPEEKSYQETVWDTYLEKHREAVTDNVNHPEHYTSGGIECIEAIEAQLTPEEYRGYLKGNVAKYVWREKYKGNNESLRKAQWYLSRLVCLPD